MSHWDRNAAILSQRFAAVRDEVAQCDLSRTRVQEVLGTQRSFSIDGIHLASAFNAAAEAVLQADPIDRDAPRATVYGIGLGDLPRALLGRSALQSLRVVLISRREARVVFERTDQTDWLADPRVELVLARDVPPTIRSPFAVAPACLRLADADAMPTRDALLLALASDFQAAYFEGKDAWLRDRLGENEALVASDASVQTLWGRGQGRRAVVAAGGPTLHDALPWLKSERASLYIVAVTTALAPLERAGVIPDAVCIIDPLAEMRRHFDVLTDLSAYKNVPLAYLPIVDPAVLAMWPGPRCAFYARHPRYAALQKKHPRPTLFVSGTVTHPATDIAVRSGATDVVLAGADFGYPNRHTHAPGAAFSRALDDREGRMHQVPNGRGQPIGSDVNLIGYLRDLERFITAHPRTRFFRASPEGALIEGTSLL